MASKYFCDHCDGELPNLTSGYGVKVDCPPNGRHVYRNANFLFCSESCFISFVSSRWHDDGSAHPEEGH